MKDIPMYHEGSRRLQDRFLSRPLADRLVEVLARNAFTEEDGKFIGSRPLFFLSTADAEGRPECSYKGGLPGFVRVVDPQTLVFPSYDGNGMFKSLGNILVNPHVGLLFIDFETPRRLRVNGKATVDANDPLHGRIHRRATDGAGSRGSHLSKLPALHPQDADRGAVRILPLRRPRAADTEMEAVPGIQRRPSAWRSRCIEGAGLSAPGKRGEHESGRIAMMCPAQSRARR